VTRWARCLAPFAPEQIPRQLRESGPRRWPRSTTREGSLRLRPLQAAEGRKRPTLPASGGAGRAVAGHTVS